MTFGPFSKSATNEPSITSPIPDAPLRCAISILVVIFGSFVADFENGPNVIGTFWHLKFVGTFCKKVWPHLAGHIWQIPNVVISNFSIVVLGIAL